MINKSPAFQFYPEVWISAAEVIAMSPEEEGHYIRLCGICWLEGSLPSDPEEVQSLLKIRCETLEKILKCFYKNPKNNSQLLHKKLEKERKKQKAWRLKSAKGGRKSKKPKKLEGENKDKGALTTVTRVVEPKGNTMVSVSNSVSNSKSKDKTKSDSLPKNETWNLIKQEAFEKRWDSYPGKKDGKKASNGHWNSSIKNYKDIQTYDLAIENYRKNVRTERDNGFKDLSWKNGATWFNNWQDWIPVAPVEEKYMPPEPPKPRVPGNPVLEKFWSEAKEKIKPQVNPDSFKTWFEPTYPRSLSNGLLTIAVPNQYFRKNLIENYQDLIECSLSDIRGSPILVDFRIATR